MDSIIDKMLDPLAQLLEIHYPPIFAFMLMIIILIVALLYFSLVISDLKSKVKELTHKISLLEFEMKDKHTS